MLGSEWGVEDPALVVQIGVLLQGLHTQGLVWEPLPPGVAFRAKLLDICFAKIAMYDVGTVIQH